jgi:stress response protein YsnF
MATQTMPNIFALWADAQKNWIEAQRNWIDVWTRPLTSRRDVVPSTGRDMHTQNQRNTVVRAQEESRTQDERDQVIAIGEEQLEVSTRRISGATTRVRRVVRQVPVERQVELHDESVIVERHDEDNGLYNGTDALVEREYAMSDTREVPVIVKRMRVRGQVVLRKHSTSRTEVVRETVRRADVEVEQPQRMPVIVAKEDVREEYHAGPEKRDYHPAPWAGQDKSEQKPEETHQEVHTARQDFPEGVDLKPADQPEQQQAT